MKTKPKFAPLVIAASFALLAGSLPTTSAASEARPGSARLRELVQGDLRRGRRIRCE